MYSLSIVLSFLSIWCLYAISTKVAIEKKGLSLWLSSHVSVAKILSGCFFTISTLIFLLNMGLVIAILTSISLWMLLASLITLFTPFERIRPTHLGLILVLSIGLEFLFAHLQH